LGLPKCLQSTFSEFDGQGIFIDFFQKAASQGVANSINAADDFFRDAIQLLSAFVDFIGVHRRFMD
jgi:hypothetical protein